MGHARAILSLDSDQQVREARDAIVKGGLTVREAESLVKRLKSGQKPKTKAVAVEVHAADLVEQLQRRFMTRIAVRKSGKGGKIEIAYGSRDELARIVDILLG